MLFVRGVSRSLVGDLFLFRTSGFDSPRPTQATTRAIPATIAQMYLMVNIHKLIIDENVQRETIVDLGQSTTQSRTDNVSGVHETVQTSEVQVTLLRGNQISNHTIP